MPTPSAASTTRALRFIGPALALTVTVTVTGARADEAVGPSDVEAFETGVTAYEGGRYPACVDRLGALLAPGRADAIRDGALRVRARMYYATCLLGVRREADAERQLEQLVLEDTRYAPDPAAFPGPAVDRFTAVRTRLRPEIERIDNARREREEAEARHRDDERKRAARRLARLEALARTETITHRHSRLVAAVPFGVGQFQNGQTAVGWALLGTEAALGVASIVTGIVVQGYLSQALSGTRNSGASQTLYNRVQGVDYATTFGLAAVAIGGVVHAEVTFVPEQQEIRPRKLPPDIALTPRLTPTAGGGLVGVIGRF